MDLRFYRIWWESQNLRGGFCEFVNSALDTNPQNLHKKHKMDSCVVWLIGVGKVGRILLFAKAKSSKSF